MPIVTPLQQVQGQQQQNPTSPTSSQQSQRRRQTPPSPESSFNKPGQQSFQDDRDHEQELNGSDSELPVTHPNPHPQLVHSHSFSTSAALQQQQQHAQALGFVRPTPVAVRGGPGPTQFLGDSGRWTMTDDLAADIERADRLQRAADLVAAGQAPPGAGGVAYAGGAVSFERFKSGSPPKNSPIGNGSSTLEREKDGETGHTAGMGRRGTVTQASYQRERGRDTNTNPSNTKRTSSRPLTPEVTTNPARDRKSTRLNSSHSGESRMPSSA